MKRRGFVPPRRINQPIAATTAQRDSTVTSASALPVSTSLAVPVTSSDTQYYRVLYTKRNPQKKRKNKTFADGFLQVKPDDWCMLYDQVPNFGLQ